MSTNTTAHRPATSDHVHDAVPLETAFDFLNTLELENGALVERLTSLDTAASMAGGCRRRARRDRDHAASLDPPPSATALLGRLVTTRTALRDVAHAVAHEEAPTRAAIDEVNRRPAVPRADRARRGRRRRPARPQPRRRRDRRRPRPDRRADRARDRQRPRRPDPDLRQRHLPLDLLRRVAGRPPPLVRHGDLRQPGEGPPPSARRQESEDPASQTRLTRVHGRPIAWTGA